MSQQPSELQDLVRALDRLSWAIEGGARGSAGEEFEVVQSDEDRRSHGYLDSARISRIAEGDYEALADLVVPCPDRYRGLCSRLSGGHRSADYRANRAWESGVWAYFALLGKIAKPRSSKPIDIKSTVYVILRAPQLSAPARVSRAGDLYRLVGRLSDDVICHGFGSLAEAETYCAGAGVPLPSPHRWEQ